MPAPLNSKRKMLQEYVKKYLSFGLPFFYGRGVIID